MLQVYLRSSRRSAVKGRAVYIHVLPSSADRSAASQDASYHVCKPDSVVASTRFSQKSPSADNIPIKQVTASQLADKVANKQVTEAPQSVTPTQQHLFIKPIINLDPGPTIPPICWKNVSRMQIYTVVALNLVAEIDVSPESNRRALVSVTSKASIPRRPMRLRKLLKRLSIRHKWLCQRSDVVVLYND